ncbi:MAG: DUF166 family protein [Candidatus Bathyarchaeia archaeon]
MQLGEPVKKDLRLCFIYGKEYAERVIGNLCNPINFCQSCGLTCGHCRQNYGTFAENISGVYELTASAQDFLEYPENLFPTDAAKCNVIIAIGLHPDLLHAVPLFIEKTDAKALIVPIEEENWCSAASQRYLSSTLLNMGVEYAFPKPFCSFDYSHGPILNEFIKKFRIGKPKLEVEVRYDTIHRVYVSRSAPCGSTWYVAQCIKGRRTENIEDVVAVAHHSYPCTASMTIDPQLNDTILHKAGHIIREAVIEAIKKAQR